VKWTNNKCPKSKIAIKFFRKKAVKTILLEGWRYFMKISLKKLPT